MRRLYFSLIFLLLGSLFQSSIAQTSTYSTAGAYVYTVGTGVTSLNITVSGAQGGTYSTGIGGLGGRVQANYTVTPGSLLYVFVGGAGGGGNGGAGGSSSGGEAGGVGGGSGGGSGGGAASDVRTSITGGATSAGSIATRVLVGGGGGGADWSCSARWNGGAGGYPAGGNGGASCSSPATGGNQSTGGTGNCYSGCGGNGTQGNGGAGTFWGGGGGGGYWGGGGGSESSGGGGSSYAGAGTSSVSYTNGVQSGAGSVVITVNCTAIGAITGTLTVCAGATTTLANTTAGGAGTWTSSNTAVGTISASGVVTGLTPGTTTISYDVSSPCGGTSATAVVTVNATPGAITGTAVVCNGSTSTLNATPSGGTFTSGTTSVATIGGTSGVVSSVSPGTSTISYSLGNGCTASTRVFTVNAQPASITGSSTICGGTVPTTVTLSDATSGGTWSSGSPTIASVGSSTGVVTGIASGTATISYTLPTGCFTTTGVPVNAVAPITGSPSVCLGYTSALSDATSGGTWSSTNTSVATINSSGVVTSVSTGSTVISYTVSSLSCSAVLTISVTNAPTTYAVTGGGSYCAGGAGVHIGVNSSTAGTTYYLFNGATLLTTALGTGSSVDFGFVTASGTYTVVANYGTPCAATMSGSATVSVNPLPTAFSVTGGGAYCAGGAGVNVLLSSSTIGVNYQLMLGATPIGSPIVGTSGAINFGLVTSAGTYTVIATNASTACVNTMAGGAVVSINPLPTSFSITGGGSFCLGGAGVHIGVGGSQVGTTYQLLLSGSPVGAALSGTGSALDFGFITVGGLYTVLATNTATGCTNAMSGVATVTVNPLPTVFTVTGGGSYCLGGTGVAVSLNSSTVGVNYQLFNGPAMVGSPVAGTGSALNFGLQTTAGSYTVVATNATTGCVSNMFGSVSIVINPLPSIFSVTGGGSYCAGGTGVVVGLSGSSTGTNYQLFNGATLVGAASGTGSPLSFGLQLGAGTYTVVATNSTTGCVGNMSGSVNVVINPLPTIFTVTGGGNYCSGGTGVLIGLNGSTTGVNYQLYNGSTAVGATVPGTGLAISFGLQTAAGSYTVVAVNATTTCTSNMSGSVVITINPLPTTYAVIGGGGYCAGGAGMPIGLAASNTGISYQLMLGGSPVGGPVAGTGSAITFGTIAVAGTYTVVATNTTTACVNNMSGSATVSINALPTVFTINSAGTSYCAGGTGVVVGLGGSTTGVNYQLYKGGVPTGGAVPGTGSAISFGAQTAAGTYTAIATTASTGCSSNMTGSIVISINPLPTTYAVTGGGNYCSGGAGVHVGLSSSQAGINYQLMNGLATVGASMPGTGGALDFGFVTGAGSYTVVATDGTTGCTNTMTGSATVNINPLPALYTITGGGNYCAGGTGVHIGLSSSAIGTSYQLYLGATPVGSPIAGTTLALDFGLKTAAGTYTVKGTIMATGCATTMTGAATIVVNPLPALHTVTGGGNYCIGGTGVDISIDGSDAGTNYQLYNGATPVGAAVPGTGAAISFGMHTAAGIYTVMATNTGTGCTGNMTGTATVGTYPLPVVYNMTGGGNYCSGGAGMVVGLSGSNTGATYQLFVGSTPLSTLTGTGLALNFGLQTTAGVYTVVATNTATGCTKTMNGVATVGVNALPTAYIVTGGGNYCTGGTGVHIGLNGSNTGVIYQLMNGLSVVGAPLAGTGAPLDFGLKTAAGNYTVVATNVSTTCTNTMTGSVNVVLDPLPAAYILSGGGNYCSGGAGVDITLSGSDAGVTYQLMNGTTLVGPSMPGTGASIDFGFQTGAGTYTVVATDLATGCTSNMTGSVPVVINPLPTTYIVGGGGSYCAGGNGVHVTISGSNTGISYQLQVDGFNTGSVMAGTGMGIDFGLQTTGGVYTVVATNNTTLCTNNMTGSVTVVVNPLPTRYSVSSTSSTYCAGGTGVHIWLNSSDAGINYQLYNGSTATGLPQAGSGGSVDFGFLMTAGSYSVVGVNATTGCVDTMTSSVAIVVNPLPTVHTITGGGNYCNGSAGVHVGLSGSNSGISYELLRGGAPTGITMPGTGAAIDFGLQTIAGAYTVVATNTATTCVNNMSGTANVSVSPMPVVFAVFGGGNYCVGGTGMPVNLNGSSLGVNYQLYVGSTLVGSAVAGTGSPITFGLQTATGTYTVVATNAITSCSATMSSSAVINTNPLPSAYVVTGGGNFCPGGTGVHVGIGGSNVGISYQLYNGSTATGPAVTGTGSALDFGLQTAAGTYTVMATNSLTGCVNTMSGNALVIINPLPVVYAVTGGGNYCAGGAGVHIGLANSQTGVSYTLYSASLAMVTLPGTGAPLDFGLFTTAGTYTVIATNTTTGCSSNMSGGATVGVNPTVAPSVTITSSGGSVVCDGNFITFTANPVNGGSSPTYQWTVNSVASAVGASYGYMPSNGDVIGVTLTSSAACASPAMVNATMTMTVDPSQTPVVTVDANPGTVVCQGTLVTFTATPSFGGTGPTYTWVKNGVSTVTTSTYSYVPADGDVVYCLMTSDYHCRLANSATSTHINMQVDVPTLPVVTIVANPGLNIGAGQTATFVATVVNGGPTPSYQWLVNGTPVSGATIPTFVSNSIADGDSVTCQVLSSGGCPGLLGFNSVTMHVSGVGVAQVSSSSSDIKLLPNPNKGIFTVKGTLGTANNEAVTLEITNMVGQVVYNAKVSANNGVINERIELGNNVANGMYILSLRAGTEHKVFHMVVEQ